MIARVAGWNRAKYVRHSPRAAECKVCAVGLDSEHQQVLISFPFRLYRGYMLAFSLGCSTNCHSIKRACNCFAITL